MKVLLTTVILKSGVLTHVWDLAKSLKSSGVKVGIAILEIEGGKRETDHSLINPIVEAEIPYTFYKSDDELLAYARKNKFQLIHAHSRLVFSSSTTVSKKLSIPLILTLHGPFKWRKFYKRSLSHAKQIIAIGPAQAKHTGLIGSNKLTIIENGINLKHFKPLETRQVDSAHLNPIENTFRSFLYYGEAPLNVLWFGRSNGSASEGVNALNQAIKHLQKKGLSIDAQMIGSNQASSTDAFHSIGWVDDPVPYLQRGDIVFGHGRALREAMACENVGFLLGEGYGGMVRNYWFKGKEHKPISALGIYKLPKPDPSIIAKDIETLYNNKELLEKKKTEARKIAEKYFDVEQMVSETIKVYKKALTSTKPKKKMRTRKKKKN